MVVSDRTNCTSAITTDPRYLCLHILGIVWKSTVELLDHFLRAAQQTGRTGVITKAFPETIDSVDIGCGEIVDGWEPKQCQSEARQKTCVERDARTYLAIQLL